MKSSEPATQIHGVQVTWVEDTEQLDVDPVLPLELPLEPLLPELLVLPEPLEPLLPELLVLPELLELLLPDPDPLPVVPLLEVVPPLLLSSAVALPPPPPPHPASATVKPMIPTPQSRLNWERA